MDATAQYAAAMVALGALGWTKKGAGEEDTEHLAAANFSVSHEGDMPRIPSDFLANVFSELNCFVCRPPCPPAGSVSQPSEWIGGAFPAHKGTGTCSSKSQQ